MPVLTAAVTKQPALAAIAHKGPSVLNRGDFRLQSTVSRNFSSKANNFVCQKGYLYDVGIPLSLFYTMWLWLS